MTSEINNVQELVHLAKTVGLMNSTILDVYTVDELSKIYNGIGSESFPEWLRQALSSLHPSLEVVALIHDVEWENSNGTYESFTMSNERFRENGYLM